MKILKKTDIENFLKEDNLYDEDSDFIWATKGSLYFIVAFVEKGIVLLPIGALGDLTGDISLLEKQDIKSVEFKKKLLGYKLIISDSNSDSFSFVVRPFMIGYKGQKESIANIIANLI